MTALVFEKLFWLAALHFIGDFQLQNDFIAENKQPGRSPLWPGVLSAHAAGHAVLVALVLGPAFGAAEFVAHWLSDFAKARGWMGVGPVGFYVDQAVHLATKILWLALWLTIAPGSATVL